ncbi:MAG: dTMP kinase [Candidatus Desulfofervidaceae bacterium]|nr:dTMP kinase [Candidatus Desulfofervidaceae bacterium]MDL1970797.1 dTMP kinase [Candidatus Desulfofervidaceae bacterium]
MSVFITFEGIEGCGKTTQLKLLANWLVQQGKKIYITYEPGDTSLGEKLREILLSPILSPCAQAELLLYIADRVEHVQKQIKPALKQGKIVLCDRYHDSTLAYQGYGRKIDISFIQTCFSCLNLPLPHLTFLLDCPVEIGLKRIKDRNLDRIEQEEFAFHKRVREGFLKLAKADPRRIKIIDATLPVMEIQTKIRHLVQTYGL